MLALERKAVEHRVHLTSRVQSRVGELLHRWRANGRTVLHPSGSSVTDRSIRQTSTIILSSFVDDYNAIERMVDSAIASAGPSAAPTPAPAPTPTPDAKPPLTSDSGPTIGQFAVAGLVIGGGALALYLAARGT
jgi:hypothetical protein